ncbi:fatty acid synthase-like [Photinus pyralis]|nr:fatty acid synthase-like [Photinus pyralis]
MSGCFPKCENVEELFESLRAKRYMLDAVPRHWKVMFPEVPPTIGRISHLDRFDAGFFDVHRYQANGMDPGSRKLLEKSVEALLDSGTNPDSLRGSATGVFMANGLFNECEEYLLYQDLSSPHFGITGGTRSMHAQRVSYFLGLEGPVVNVDTACSSSFYALEHAFRAIKLGLCENAIVGGTSFLLNFRVHSGFFHVGILDKEGIGNVFDDSAGGIVRSETVAVIFLQKMKDAKRIYAKVVHTKTNCDGYKPEGILTLSENVKQELLEETYTEARVDPRLVNFVEAHATGTKMGEPPEISALSNVFCADPRTPLYIASVKSNMGHSEAASGMGSLIKVLLGMENNCLLPNKTLTKMRSDISALCDGKIRVLTEVMEDRSKYVGINNYGIGGTNAHLILERAESCTPEFRGGHRLICISARTRESCELTFKSATLHARNENYLSLLQSTYRENIAGFHWRGFLLLQDGEDVARSVEFCREKRKQLRVLAGGEAEEWVEVFHSIKDLFREDLYGICKGVVFEKMMQNLELGEEEMTMARDLSQLALIAVLERLRLPTELTDLPIKNQVTLLGVESQPQHVPLQNNFLVSLGRLYQLGFNPRLEQLYPPPAWPVKAPLISPSIKWNHEESYHYHDFKVNLQYWAKVFKVSLGDDELLSGHVVDGQLLIPATLYLSIVWRTHLEHSDLLLEEGKVVFENVRFLKKLVLSTNRFQSIQLTVQICKVSKKFEVFHGENVLVTGIVRSALARETIDDSPIATTTGKVLKEADVYKSLKLVGYQYKGEFRGLERISYDGSDSMVKWNGNWMTYLDGIFHIMCVKEKVSVLRVPTYLGYLTVDAPRHLIRLKDQKKDSVRALSAHNCNFIRSPGVDLKSLRTTPVGLRKKPPPTLQAYRFVPLIGKLSLEVAMRVNTQLVLENTQERSITATEVIEGHPQPLLSTLIHEALLDEPRALGRLRVFSEMPLDHDHFSVERRSISDLSNDNDLVIVSDALTRPTILSAIFARLPEGGFVLSREPIGTFTKWSPEDLVSVYQTDAEELVLLRKCVKVSPLVVRVDFSMTWLDEVKRAVARAQNVLLVSDGDATSGLVGLVNCLVLEVSRKLLTCCLMDVAFDEGAHANQLRKGLLINVMRDGEWGTYRHLPLGLETQNCEHVVGRFIRGDTTKVRWIEGPLSGSIPQGLVHVYSCALNTKDAVEASGTFTTNPSTRRFTENYCAGIEIAGKDASGRRVMGLVQDGGLSNLAVADEFALWEFPREWSMEDAATVPFAYSNVVWGLIEVARIRRGQSVLVRAVDDLVLATINIARFYKCDIFAVVGSTQQWKTVKMLHPSIPATHLHLTRDCANDEVIMRETRGRGVDLILTDDAPRTPPTCLAKGGQYLAIGKHDSLTNAALRFDVCSNRTVRGVHLDNLQKCSWKRLKHLVDCGIRHGYIKPLPKVVCGSDGVVEALSEISRSKNAGKTVVRMQEEGKPRRTYKAMRKYFCHPRRVYIIVGGLGGFGLELIDWLVARGARNLIVVSRGGHLTSYQSYKLQGWIESEASVNVKTADLSSMANCEALLADALRQGELDAIFNLSGVLRNALFDKQTPETFSLVMLPKALITSNLDKVSRRLCPQLRSFVTFSSISCGKGNLGQTNYGMANSAMERICENRRRDGFSGLAVQWGPIQEVGMMADWDADAEIAGVRLQAISSCLEVLDSLLTQPEAIVSSFVVAGKLAEKSVGVDLVSDICEMLGVRREGVGMYTPLADLGMTSVSSAEILHALEGKFQRYVSLAQLRRMTLQDVKEVEESYDRQRGF